MYDDNLITMICDKVFVVTIHIKLVAYNCYNDNLNSVRIFFFKTCEVNYCDKSKLYYVIYVFNDNIHIAT